MSTLTAKFKEELYAMLPPTLFFFIALHLVVLIRILMLKGTGIPLGTSVSVTVAALVLGKSVVIADLLPIINLFPTSRWHIILPGRPYSTFWYPCSSTTWSASLTSGARQAVSSRVTRSCSRKSCGRISGPYKSSL